LLIVSYIFSVFELPQLDQQSSVSTALQLQYNVRNPPRDSQPRGSIIEISNHLVYPNGIKIIYYFENHPCSTFSILVPFGPVMRKVY
jgi:hypothetical protein